MTKPNGPIIDGTAREVPDLEIMGQTVSVATARKASLVEKFHMSMLQMPTEDKMAVLMVAMAKTLDELVNRGTPRGQIINAATADFKRLMQINVVNPGSAIRKG